MYTVQYCQLHVVAIPLFLYFSVLVYKLTS